MEEVEDGGKLPHGTELPAGKLRRKRRLDERGDHSPGLLLLLLFPAGHRAALRLRRAGSGGDGGGSGGAGAGKACFSERGFGGWRRGARVVLWGGGSVRVGGRRGRWILRHGEEEIGRVGGGCDGGAGVKGRGGGGRKEAMAWGRGGGHGEGGA